MRITGLGVISEATVPLGPGLTVVTGETGAGKTMVVTGLTALLGGRVDSAAVRHGHNRALVEGCFTVAPGGAAATRAIEAGADQDDLAAGDLIITRTIAATGRNRAHLGGCATPLAVLREVSEHLAEVHGQCDQMRLRSPQHQRTILDGYAGLTADLDAYTSTYREYTKITNELESIKTKARERAQESDALRLGLESFDRINPAPNEDNALREEILRRTHTEDLRTAAAKARTALTAHDETSADNQPEALNLLSAAQRTLETVGQHDPQLANLAIRLAEATFLVTDIAADLAIYLSELDTDPQRLDTALTRQSELAALCRRYGDTIEDVIDWALQARNRLLTLDSDDQTIDELTQKQSALDNELNERATLLTARRREAAEKLSTAATSELNALAMPKARIHVQVKEQKHRGPTGKDEVAIQLEPHPGAPPRPITEGASGGELSRVMLALEVVAAHVDPTPTYVFDEVDAGVGGRAATEVGRRLSVLSRQAQVIVVTHLPQVAAFADQHLTVRKSDDGNVTLSDVAVLNHDERVTELARMLAGQEDSPAAREHAAELLDHAERSRSEGC